MTSRTIQRITYAGAVLVAFTFTACAEKKQKATNTENHEHHEGMAHGDNMLAAGKEVVEVPDYTSVSGPIKAQIAALIDSYLKVKDGLIAANAEEAQTEAKLLLAAAGKVDVSALEGEQKQFAEEKLDDVKQSASKIAEATDVNVQRENLELLSEATFSLTKAFGATDQKLYYQHCPMAMDDKGAYWLSSSEEIRNPYFGDKMLKCGSTEEMFN